MDKIKFLFSGVFEFLRPLIMELCTEGGKILIQAAKETVLIVEADMLGVPGTEKKKVAMQKIEHDLKMAGVRMTARVISTTIDAAVQRYLPK
jgi:hypothetical protein